MNTIIGKPFSPSTTVSNRIIEATAIEVSCGGGMGGSHWTEFTTEKIDLNNNFITVNTNRHINHTLNTKFIVSTYPCKIVELKLKNTGNGSIGEIGEIVTYYYLVNYADNIVFSEEISSRRLDTIEVINNSFIK